MQSQHAPASAGTCLVPILVPISQILEPVSSFSFRRIWIFQLIHDCQRADPVIGVSRSAIPLPFLQMRVAFPKDALKPCVSDRHCRDSGEPLSKAVSLEYSQLIQDY